MKSILYVFFFVIVFEMYGFPDQTPKKQIVLPGGKSVCEENEFDRIERKGEGQKLKKLLGPSEFNSLRIRKRMLAKIKNVRIVPS